MKHQIEILISDYTRRIEDIRDGLKNSNWTDETIVRYNGVQSTLNGVICDLQRLLGGPHYISSNPVERTEKLETPVDRLRMKESGV